MIDPQKETAVGLLPLRVTFVKRKIDELEIVAVRILEVKSLDAGRGLVPVGNPLPASGGLPYVVRAELLVGLIHVAHDNRNVLEPLIVAARVSGYRSAFGRKVFGEFDGFVAQPHAHDSHSHSEDS